MQLSELLHIKETYLNSDTIAIKNNLKRLIKANKVSHGELSELLQISTHTAYSYTKNTNKNKPELFNLLILAYYFNVTIYDILT